MARNRVAAQFVGNFNSRITPHFRIADVGFAAEAATIRSVPKLIQTCSTEGFQVVLPVGIVFDWYLAGDPRQ